MLGLGFFGIGAIPPAFIPGADGSTLRWQHIAENASIAGVLCGCFMGIWIGIFACTFIIKKSENKASSTDG